jgi:hypothetical protein
VLTRLYRIGQAAVDVCSTAHTAAAERPGNGARALAMLLAVTFANLV